MMAKNECRRFRVSFTLNIINFIIFFLSTSCATSSHATISQDQDILKEISELRADLSDQQVETGSVDLVRVEVPKALRSKSLYAEFDGMQLPLFPVGEKAPGVYETLLSIPYERKPGPAIVTVSVGQKNDPEVKKIPLKFEIKEGNYLSEILKVDGKRVNPKGKKILARIAREQKEIGAIYSKETPNKFWTGPFHYPVKNSTITSPYGTKRIYNGTFKNFHTGLDLKAPMGTPIRSAANGVVVLAKDLFFSGNTVIVDHGYGVMTVYAHMSKMKVKKGQEVTSDQLIGLSGKTGRVNGPHLHWQTVVHQVKVNPLTLLKVTR